MQIKSSTLYIIFLLAITICIVSCKKDAHTDTESSSPLFDLKDNKSIGIDFTNELNYTNDFNVYKYRNFYNGGGVSIGDINNDGLADLYLVSNQKANKLYLNKGDWQFDDITEQAGVGGKKAWSTGVTMADVNGDGLLDIYVCNSGDVKGDNKENELFINNGDLTFTESAAQYGLNDKGFSTHASFFDYDKDGDLDCYILNNSFQAIGSFNLKKNERPKRDELGGDKLMRNDGGTFTDVSQEAGIYGSVIGFGLGITVGDVNNDGWEDIFISNDFFERDYLYINNQDGTFSEDLESQMPSISGASMGADIGDINNDGWNDIFVTEMLPYEYERLKTVTTFEDWDRYQYGVNNGYHHQFTRNILHLNNGNNTFSDVSRLAGVEASDWSWGALFFDMDNDGLKDLFIANGIYRDLTNQDYLQYVANESVMNDIIKDEGVDYKKLIDIIPSNPVANQAYLNKGALQFEPYKASGLWTPSFSNGSAYGDLDNDGDLDLVVNNINMPAFIYDNKANQQFNNNWIKVVLHQDGANPFAYGATVKIIDRDKMWKVENQPIRGFQSSVDTRLNIGLGASTLVDIEVIWPDGQATSHKSVKANQSLTIDKAASSPIVAAAPLKANVQKWQTAEVLPFTHVENKYNEFDNERLNYHMMSTRGPCVSMGDLNGDGQDDIFVPGAKGVASGVLYKRSNTQYSSISTFPFLDKLKEAEHVKCDLFDADGDGDLDAYIASGGVEVSPFSPYLFDELVINDGKGNFTSSGQKLPNTTTKISTGAIAHGDVDGDGDQDLFVGERVKIGSYGAPGDGYILINDGQGGYTDKTEAVCREMKHLGMITDARWTDLDGDGDQDLIVVGEFMDVTIFTNNKGTLTKNSAGPNLHGWWNVIELADIDNDGDQDIILGNHGLNSRFKASKDKPIKLYYNDFDKNGFAEGVMTTTIDGKDFPVALRHNLMMKLPMLKKKYPNFESFKNQSITEIFTPEQLKGTYELVAQELRSCILINEGKMSFKMMPLPNTVQMSPIYAIKVLDVNDDGYKDLVMGGNLYNVQPEMGRYDASYGHVMINDTKGNFSDYAKEYGMVVKGEIRDIEADDNYIYILRNNDKALAYKYKN